MAVVRNDEVRFAVYRALKNAVVIWIGRDCLDRRARGDHSPAGNTSEESQSALHALLWPTEISAKHAGGFPDNGW
jgi:hypothetical protein